MWLKDAIQIWITASNRTNCEISVSNPLTNKGTHLKTLLNK